MSTDPNAQPSGTPDDEHATSPEQVESTAERIAAEAEGVRDRVRDLILNAVNGQAGGIAELRRTADAVLAGIARGVKNAGEGRREGVLNEAASGLADGVSRSVNATRLALREAEGRGQRFAEEDLKRTVEDLRTIEKLFAETVVGFFESLSKEVSGQAGDVKAHAERTAADAKAEVGSALEAALAHPQKIAGEAVSTAADAARQGVGALFQVASGLLDAAADVASEAAKRAETPRDKNPNDKH